MPKIAQPIQIVHNDGELSILKIDSVMTQNLFLQWNSLCILVCNIGKKFSQGLDITYENLDTTTKQMNKKP